MIFREGEKSWHEKSVGSRRDPSGWRQRQAPGSTWGGQGPCLGLGGGLSSLVPMRVSPQAPDQRHFTLTAQCKQLGVLLAVLLASESSVHV